MHYKENDSKLDVDMVERFIMADENAKYERAKKRVDEIRGFYTHAIVYVCVNLILFLINLFLSPGGWWFYWPLLGWGIGLFFHGMGTFVFNRFPGKYLKNLLRVTSIFLILPMFTIMA